MPETKHHAGTAHEQLLNMLKAVHSESKSLEEKVGECPVFKTKEGCPFKDASKEGKPLIEPPAAVLESLTASDVSKLKEKCPAFKEGCPFAKMENEALLEEIKKCPEFKEGCAFKDAKTIEEIHSKLSQMPSTDKDCHHKEALMETMKLIHSVGHDKADECPVLQKEGCPFKDVESEGKPLISPAEAVLPVKKQSESEKPSVHFVHLTDLTDLKETCPAFESGCPFAKVGEKDFGKELKQCPEFKEGCPFKDSEVVGDIYKKLVDLPSFSVEGSHGAKLLDIFKHIHEVSHSLKDEMGECPVFVTDEGCPFKTVCSDGKPLINKLDGQLWTKILESSIDNVIENVNEEIEKTEPSIQLSKELKKGTKKVHREAESIHFVKEFARGRIERHWYKELIADLYFVYRALEEESEKHKDHEMFKAVHFPKELGRLQCLEEDMEFYFGEDWKEQVPMSDATKDYVNRIHEVADKDPALLIAHHYTRYLGDLSGGQILRKMAMKAMDLPSTGEGVQFYVFENITDAKKFKNMYRSRLDGLNIDKVKSDEIVKEANYVFMLNIYLFQEIDALAGFEEQDPKKKKLTVEEIYSSVDTSSKEAAGVCPFATMAKKPAQVNTTAPSAEATSINPVLLAIIIAVAAIVIGLVVTKMR
ncbi:heme oxygenase (decycling) 1 [Desmophyllum pertusum]|uniref:heme oxygenase (biliverdin-producing) n=1 Tax=Desmophyllum pertusum TaxID=174260 RepID=A0A9W9YUV0_9CNID|nr:heme oxygenase (decycling) 1 [Desmophyllum pertusum]